MKRFLLLAILLLPLFLGRPKGFTKGKITSHCPRSKEYAARSHLTDEELDTILNCPFSYLGSGKECYVFASSDYVIKFFKQKHMNTYTWKDRLPILGTSKWRRETRERRRALRKKSFSSFEIAFDFLPDLTGIAYLHLSKTNHLKKRLYLTDHKNRPFSLNLDDMEFLIQKRATPVISALKELSKEEVESAIKSMVCLICERAARGISDFDLNCERNLGLIGCEAIEIDIGEFGIATEPTNLACELREATRDLEEWLQKEHPDLVRVLKQEIAYSL